MENYFGLVAAVVLVVIVAVAFAIASNRADEASSANKQRNKQKSNKDKKSNKKGKQKNKPLPNVVFKSDGKIENEDESMIDLIQGTAKYYAQEAKQASDAAAKKLQAAAAETKATADKAVKGAKNAAKKVVAAVDEQLEEGTYTSVSRPRNNTRAKPETKDSAGENVVPQFSGKKKGNKAFLKSDIPEPKEKGQPGERRQKREKKQDSTENAGDKPAVDGEAKPQRQRNRPPRQDDAAKTEGDANAVEGEEDRRPRQPRGPPKEPKEKKPPVFQPIPVALTLDTNDVLSKKNLDEMLGYMSSHYRTQETVFSRLAEVSSQRIARDTRRYKDQAVAKKLRPVNTLSGEQIIVKILSKLSLRDIVAVSQVDQFFSKITRGDALWKALGARDFGITKDNKDNKDKQNNNKKDNKKPPRAKALYRDKYDESKGRKTAKPAAKPKSSDSPKTEVNKPAATGSPSEDAEKKTQKKGEKKKKDTTA